MPTVINNPPTTEQTSNTGLIVGLIFLIVFAFLLFYYAVPALRRASGPQLNVPSKIDVNVNQPNQPSQ